MSDDEDPTIIAERLRVLTARVQKNEDQFNDYLRNGVRAIFAAAGYVLWEPVKHLLVLAGVIK